jgi:hypothetical protein
MQSVAEAMFGTCKVCGLMLEVDGSCPEPSKHPTYECADCGATHSTPLTLAHPCMFCGCEKAA